MALRSGAGAQVGLGSETTYGTYFVPTLFQEFVSEGLDYNRETIESNAIRKGSTIRRKARWARNDKGGGGPIEFEISTTGFGKIFKHSMGTSVITTPGGATLARLHKYTLGDLDDISLTIQKGIPIQDDGVVKPFAFLGSVCTGWEMSVAVDGLLLFTPTFDCQRMTTADAIATATFPVGSLFGYQNCAITVAGVAREPLSITLSCAHGVATDRYVINTTGLKRRPVIADFRTISGTMTTNFDNMTDANYFLTQAPGSEIAIVFTATHPTFIEGATAFSLTGTMPACEITGGFVTVGGPDLVTTEVAWTSRDDLTLAPITLDWVTSDTTD